MNASYPVLYTVALCSFFLPAFWRLVPMLASSAVRWASLVILTGATASIVGRRAASMPGILLAGLVPFWLYALLTVMWSQNPDLTLVKWTVLVLGSAVFLYGGIAIGRARASGNPFLPLAPLGLMATVASLLAIAQGDPYAYVAASNLFQGYVEGPNMLGSVLAFSTPFLLVQLTRRWHEPKERLMWLGLAGAAITILVMTRSRAAMLLVLFVLSFGLLAAASSRRVFVALTLAILLVTSYVAFPDFYVTTVQTYVYKSGRRVLQTREKAFSVSLEKAREGGNFGVGYGISSGESWEWSWELTSVGFGREKGNSQLAILEELGVVGFVLYLALLATAFLALVLNRHKVPRRDPGHLYHYLTIGFLIGATANSAFEAWFTAPGSPEGVAFWATLGLGLGALQGRSAVASHGANHP